MEAAAQYLLRTAKRGYFLQQVYLHGDPFTSATGSFSPLSCSCACRCARTDRSSKPRASVARVRPFIYRATSILFLTDATQA